MRHCPEWTDHNVSDPGITLIETFAYMTDGLFYRLNQVPDRLYVKFLELIGLKLLPATPARCGVTFWLSSPAQAPIVIPLAPGPRRCGSEVDEPVVFATTEDLTIVPCAVQDIATRGATETPRHAGQAGSTGRRRCDFGRPFPAFSAVPGAGDTLLVALTEAVPRCAVMLQFMCTIEGVGVDPTNPPLVWEAWDGTSWIWLRRQLGRDGWAQPKRRRHCPRAGDPYVRRPSTVSAPAGCEPGWSRRPTISQLHLVTDDPWPHGRDRRRDDDVGSRRCRCRRDARDIRRDPGPAVSGRSRRRYSRARRRRSWK